MSAAIAPSRCSFHQFRAAFIAVKATAPFRMRSMIGAIALDRAHEWDKDRTQPAPDYADLIDALHELGAGLGFGDPKAVAVNAAIGGQAVAS